MAKNNETRLFCVLCSDKTWVFDQSERAQCPIYVIKLNNALGAFFISSYYVQLEVAIRLSSLLYPFCT